MYFIRKNRYMMWYQNSVNSSPFLFCMKCNNPLEKRLFQDVDVKVLLLIMDVNIIKHAFFLRIIADMNVHLNFWVLIANVLRLHFSCMTLNDIFIRKLLSDLWITLTVFEERLCYQDDWKHFGISLFHSQNVILISVKYLYNHCLQ